MGSINNHIVKFLADVLSFMYFPQRNTLESNISWLVLKIDKKMQKNDWSDNLHSF